MLDEVVHAGFPKRVGHPSHRSSQSAPLFYYRFRFNLDFAPKTVVSECNKGGATVPEALMGVRYLFFSAHHDQNEQDAEERELLRLSVKQTIDKDGQLFFES